MSRISLRFGVLHVCVLCHRNKRHKDVIFVPEWPLEEYIEKLIWQEIEQRLQKEKRISLLTIAKEVDMVPKKLKELLSGIFGDAYTDGWMTRLPEAADLTIRTIEYKVSMDFNAVLSQLAEKGVKLQVLECPHCSGKVTLPETGNQTQCKHCGKDIFAVDLYEKFSAILQPLTSTQPTATPKIQASSEKRKCICGKEYEEHQRFAVAAAQNSTKTNGHFIAYQKGVQLCSECPEFPCETTKLGPISYGFCQYLTSKS